MTGVRADAGQFYLAPGLQGMNYDDEVGFDNDFGYVIGIGYDFTSKLSAELSVVDLNPETKAARELDQDLWKVDVFYGLDFDLGNFKPFVVSGLGNSNIDGDNDSIWDIGAGLRRLVDVSRPREGLRDGLLHHSCLVVPEDALLPRHLEIDPYDVLARVLDRHPVELHLGGVADPLARFVVPRTPFRSATPRAFLRRLLR